MAKMVDRQERSMILHRAGGSVSGARRRFHFFLSSRINPPNC